MGVFIDISGLRYGKLVVISYAGKTTHRQSLWQCLCDCGNLKIVSKPNLVEGNTRSCGCLKVEYLRNKMSIHGKSKTNLYRLWANMIQRCINPKRNNYKWYGNKGIRVCEKWRNNFEEFMKDMGPRPPKFSIDRIDPNGDYTPTNCRWADAKTQTRNRIKKETP